MYVKQSVPRAAGSPGRGIHPQDEVVLVDVDDILNFPSPDENGVVIADDLVMKPGKYGVGIYQTPGTAELTSAAEGDPDKIGFTPSVKFEHPGNEQEVREFKAYWVNKRIIVIVRYCNNKPADLIGTPCNPCTLTPSYTGNKDGNTNEMTVTQMAKGDDIFIYKGTLPLEEPVAVVPASATQVTVTAQGRYQLSSGAASITSIAGGVDGMVVTLLGTTGTAPTVAGGEGLLLRDGQTFRAVEGSMITFRAFDAGDSLVWIEQSRFPA